MKDVLLLNADFTPLKVLDWRRAICLVMAGRVLRVADYMDAFIRAPNVRYAWPAVVSLHRYVRFEHASVSLSRRNLFARDRFSCQYCGYSAYTHMRSSVQRLTVDHVVPRVRARDGRVQRADGSWVPLHSWENLVTACRVCNNRKGSGTPEQAGLHLMRRPRRPGPVEGVRIVFARVRVEEEWLPYLPDDGSWSLSEAASASL